MHPIPKENWGKSEKMTNQNGAIVRIGVKCNNTYLQKKNISRTSLNRLDDVALKVEPGFANDSFFNSLGERVWYNAMLG
jgi:hypothetical protein